MILSRLRIIGSLFCLLCLAMASPATAHPMGNFSINHYARIEAQTDNSGQGSFRIHYIIDYAEIPTVSERDAMGAKVDGNIPPASQSVYLAAAANRLRDGLYLRLDGSVIPLQIASRTLAFVPGAGGLPTMRICIDMTTQPVAFQQASVAYRDDNYPTRTGWKEIVAFADSGLRLQSTDVSQADTSKELTAYPTDATVAPLQQTEAHLIIASPGARTGVPHASSSETALTAQHALSQPPDLPFTSPESRHQSSASSARTPQDLFTQTISRKNLSGGIILLSLLIAFAFGAMHALSPGHGKAMMAAYLVGSRGVAWHAIVLGLVVTFTHTAGVFALGMVILFAAQNVTPEKLYPILSALSGLTITVIGLLLLRQRLRGLAERFDGDPEDAGWADPEEMAWEGKEGTLSPWTSAPWVFSVREPHSLRSLVALGVTGGLIPCPSALVVLLSAVGLHRVAFGMGLIVSFSLGLAIVLTAIGLCVVYTRGLSERLTTKKTLLARLPVLSAGIVTLIGLFLLVGAVLGKGY